MAIGAIVAIDALPSAVRSPNFVFVVATNVAAARGPVTARAIVLAVAFAVAELAPMHGRVASADRVRVVCRNFGRIGRIGSVGRRALRQCVVDVLRDA